MFTDEDRTFISVHAQSASEVSLMLRNALNDMRSQYLDEPDLIRVFEFTESIVAPFDTDLRARVVDVLHPDLVMRCATRIQVVVPSVAYTALQAAWSLFAARKELVLMVDASRAPGRVQYRATVNGNCHTAVALDMLFQRSTYTLTVFVVTATPA